MMKVEKEKRKVCIFCSEGFLVKGFVHINPGERIIDFINDPKEEFIAITSVEFYSTKEVRSFKMINELAKKKSSVILNKQAIRLIEEL